MTGRFRHFRYKTNHAERSTAGGMESLKPNIDMTGGEGHGIVSAEANTGNPLRGDFERMARKRYQRGQLFQKGKRQKVWVARWREDVIRADGSRYRLRRSEVLGTLKQYPTRRLAERALERRLAETEINSLSYQPRPTASFTEFAAKWQKDVLSQLKPSTRAADKSRIFKHLVPDFGEVCMKT